MGWKCEWCRQEIPSLYGYGSSLPWPWGNPHPLPLSSLVVRFSIPQHPSLSTSVTGHLLVPAWHVTSLVQFSFSSSYQKPSFICSSFPSRVNHYSLLPNPQPLWLYVLRPRALVSFSCFVWTCYSSLQSSHSHYPPFGEIPWWVKSCLSPGSYRRKTSFPLLPWGCERPGHKSVMTRNQSEAERGWYVEKKWMLVQNRVFPSAEGNSVLISNPTGFYP